MRKIRLLTSISLLCALSGTALAQSPLEGPLATPDSKPGAPAAPKKATHKPGKTTHIAHKASPTATTDSPSPALPAVAPARLPQTNDLVSFGMKWNGSNDDARATRVQNYNGDAVGTGAELGMKLHF